ncbi:MAG: diacylglycerol kinase family protein [Planctomycetes bacterium]|nr:diacylglycerol kinase family protein [Planctomycetota bacterium]
MDDGYQPAARTWRRKFRDAFRGAWLALRGQRSMRVHVVAAAGVVLAGWLLDVRAWQACVLSLCITLVLVVELLNTALERLAKAVARGQNEHVRDALDVSSAAVLAAAGGAVVVGIVVLLF